ncbi:MAG: arginine deiminase family protein [Gemmatimonadaceae bacterium]
MTARDGTTTARAARPGGQPMYAPLTRVLLKHPRDAFRDQAYLDAHWRTHGYTGCPDYERAVSEYEAFADLVARHVPEVAFAPADDRAGIDSLYIHDPAVVVERGAVLCNMGKALRRGEPAAVERALIASGVAVIGRIEGEGRLEAGDVLWVDARTVAVGRGPRTNAEGIAQLAALLGEDVDEVLAVPLPAGAFHLLGLVSLVDRDLAVVSPRLPRELRERLLARRVTLVEVPDEEHDTLGCNVLAVAPRRCIMVDGSPRTAEQLERAGATVWRYDGVEISHKGSGGPTCLTRPLQRRGDASDATPLR